MNLTKSIAAAALAVTTLGVLPATAAEAGTTVSISYRDGYRGDYRDYRDYRRDHRRWDRDHDGIPNRYDRYDNRRGWNGYGGGYRTRCWTEWQYDGWRHERTRVRVCR
ncbi:hypothetical protein [Sphingobium nicotianae]|uniref:Uncharacterized protein n=1 Tax=Sphingobium nicotianae TaxID=2782607 RepID=A0A9X1ITC8_9SPHN|nr:hypothetical protein [Sphingobium nicotianae]MBT2189210.1 hypothetical protein [Sphingobium nicotianae]